MREVSDLYLVEEVKEKLTSESVSAAVGKTGCGGCMKVRVSRCASKVVILYESKAAEADTHWTAD